MRQRVDCHLPRRKVPDAQRPLEHQGQVIGREALVGACVEDGQRRIVGETTPTVSGSRASSHCLARLSSQGRIVVVVRPSGRMDSASTGSGCRAISNRQKTADSNDLVSMSSLRWQSSPAGQKAAHPRPGACGYIGNDAAMLAGRWILFPGTHACRHSLWQPPYARLAKTLDSFASPARSMKPLAMTCALAVACLHSKAQFEPHIAEGNLVACWKAGAIHSRAITSITQVRGNLRRPSQWSSKRCDTEALALGRLGRTWQPKQQAHEGGPRCNESSPWSATATLLMCRGSILRQAASLARRRASRNVRPRSPGKRQENRPSARTFHERVRDLEAERKGPKALSQ